MSLAATQTAMYCHHFSKCSLFSSFLFEVPTFKDVLLSHILIDLLQGRKVA
jgi:hypothetical protein